MLCVFISYTSARPVTILQGLSDQKVCEGDIIQLEVKLSQENVEGVWMKDGAEIQPSDRIHIVIDKQSHMLLVEDATKEDRGAYSFNIPSLLLVTSGRVSVSSKFGSFLGNLVTISYIGNIKTMQK